MGTQWPCCNCELTNRNPAPESCGVMCGVKWLRRISSDLSKAYQTVLGRGRNRTPLLTPVIRRSLIFRNYVLKTCLGLSEVLVLLFPNSYRTVLKNDVRIQSHEEHSWRLLKISNTGHEENCPLIPSSFQIPKYWCRFFDMRKQKLSRHSTFTTDGKDSGNVICAG